MREVINLAGYEYQKIFKRRSTWIALSVVLIWTLFSGFVNVFGDYYIEGEKVDSHYRMVKTERKALENLEIKKLNQDFFNKKKKDTEGFSKEQTEIIFGEGTQENREEEWKKYYEKCYAPYDNLYNLLSMIKERIGTVDVEEIDGTNFYEYRNMMMEQIFQQEGLSEKETVFHQKENEKIETPYDYGNMTGYDNFFRLLTPNCIFIAFAAAIILAPMFAGEYTSNMDALVLSSRFGKNKLIQAKLFTGISFGAFSAIAFTGILLLEIQAVYGLSGWNLPVQVSMMGFYLTLPINLLELTGISIGCCTIAICMTAVIVMFCSAKMKSPFGVIIVSFAFIFAPVFLIYMVADYRILFMIVNSLPTSMMYPGSAVSHQLISIGNHCFYFFQWVPVMYLFLIAAFSLWSYCSFRNHQVR